MSRKKGQDVWQDIGLLDCWAPAHFTFCTRRFLLIPAPTSWTLTAALIFVRRRWTSLTLTSDASKAPQMSFSIPSKTCKVVRDQ